MQNTPTYTYNGEVGTLHLVSDALIPFRRINAATAKRIEKHS